MVAPLKGNESAIGLDYRENEAQREAALRARDSGELVLAGPVDLVQGGKGFIGRFPVFADDGHGGSYFWGIVSAVVDRDRLYRESGLLADDLPIELAITGRDGKGGAGERFFGDASTAADNPVIADVILPSGSWRIAAVPKGGWDVLPANAWMLRLLILAGGALILIPTFMTGRLIDETAEERRRTAPPRAGARAAFASPQAGARQLADRRLGTEHRDQRPVLGRPRQPALRLSDGRGPPRLHALGALDPSG